MAQIEGPFGPPDAACGDVDKSGLVCGNLCTAIAELGSRLLVAITGSNYRIEKLHLYTAEEGYVPFSVSSSQMGIDVMVGSSIVHLPKHSSVHHPVAQMVLFAIMSNNDFYCPRSMVPKPLLDITQQFGPDSCGTDVPTVYEALWVSAKIRSANARNGSAISDACGTVRKDLLSLPVLFDVSMKCEKMKSKVPESNKLPGNCCNGYTHAVPGVGPSLQLCALVKGEMNHLVCSHDAYPLVNSMEKSGCLLGSCNVPEIISDTVTSHNLQFAPSNAGTGSDFIQLHSHPDGSVSSEEHQYILNNLGHEQNHLLCAFEQPICCSKYSKGQEVLICDTESPCLSVGGRATLNSSEEWHGSQAYLLATPQSLASDGSSSSTSTSPPLLWLDSGASHHAVGDDRILCNFQDPPAGAAVRVADGFRLLVTKVGEIQTENFQIPDVYLVPGLQMNVISVRQLAKSKIIPTFYENHTELWREGELVGGAIADDETSLYGLYYLIGTGNNAAALTS